MSVEVVGSRGIIGQFASNQGFSDLIDAAENIPVLKKFFGFGVSEQIPTVVKALRELKGSEDVTQTAAGLADMIEGQAFAILYDGADDDNVRSVAMMVRPRSPK